MKIGITHVGNLEIERSGWIRDISEILEQYFVDKYYGDSLKDLVVSIVCVKPEFDFFFQKRKMKYYSGKQAITYDEITIEVENLLEYDVKLDYLRMLSLPETEFKKDVSVEILNSVHIIKKINKIKGFAFDEFHKDLNEALLTFIKIT